LLVSRGFTSVTSKDGSTNIGINGINDDDDDVVDVAVAVNRSLFIKGSFHVVIGASISSAKEAYHLNVQYDSNNNNDYDNDNNNNNNNNNNDEIIKSRILDRSVRIMLRNMIVYNTNQKLKKTLPLTNTFIVIKLYNNDNNNDDDNDDDNDGDVKEEEER